MHDQPWLSDLSDLQRRPRGLPPNAMLEQTEPVYEQLFHPMGEPLLFQTNDLDLLAAAQDAFGSFQDASGTVESAPLVLRLFVHQQGRTESIVAGDYPRPTYRTHGHLFYISVDAGSTAVADLVHGFAFGFVTPDMARNRALVRHVLLEGLAFAMLGTARHFIPVHAACVVKKATSIILLGEAGTGKSTIAFACIRRGYRFLTEDGLLIKGRPDQTTLWGVSGKLHLLPDGKDFFPELAGEQPRLQINGEWKLEIEPETLYPGSTTTSAGPGLVVFLERGCRGDPVHIRKISKTVALDAFPVVWPWWVGWTEEMERQLSCLLAQGAYSLCLNDRPDDAVDALDALLKSHGQDKS